MSKWIRINKEDGSETETTEAGVRYKLAGNVKSVNLAIKLGRGETLFAIYERRAE